MQSDDFVRMLVLVFINLPLIDDDSDAAARLEWSTFDPK